MSDAPGQRYLVLESLGRLPVQGRDLPAFWEVSLGRRFDEDTFSLVFETAPGAEMPRGYLASVSQRHEQLAAQKWPASGQRVWLEECKQGGLTLLCPSIEGEPFPAYLSRHAGLAEALIFPLVSELIASLCSLAGAPRLFSNVELDDFRIVAADGVLFTVRFCPAYCLVREEEPLSDYQLARKWTGQLARVHAFVKQGGKTPFTEVEAAAAKVFRPLFKELETGKDRSLEERLSRIGEIFESDPAAGAGRSGGGVRALTLIRRDEMPQGPLSRLLIGKVRAAHPDKLPEPGAASDRRPCFSAFVLEGTSGKGSMDRLGYLLPPERWVDLSLVDPVNRRLSHPFLKAHHNGIRLRSVYCDEDFTVLFGDVSSGLPLPSLLTCLGGVSRDDLFLLAGKLHRALAQFDSAGFDLALVTPWQVELHVEQGVSHPGWDRLLEEPVAVWPPWEIKIRVERPAESFLPGPGEESWRHVFDSLSGKFFPALIAWILDWKRFQWSAARGTIAIEPVSWDKRLEALFEAAGEHLAPGHTAQREKFLGFVHEGTEPVLKG
jgi:hypothetical protein